MAKVTGVGGIFYDYLGAGAEAMAGQVASEPPAAWTPRLVRRKC